MQPALADKIDLGAEQDLFGRLVCIHFFNCNEFIWFNNVIFLNSVISQCIQLLVADLEAACESALITMAKVQRHLAGIFIFYNNELTAWNCHNRLLGKVGKVSATNLNTWHSSHHNSSRTFLSFENVYRLLGNTLLNSAYVSQSTHTTKSQLLVHACAWILISLFFFSV